MTLNLKLVRHQDGKWTALNPETDDLTQVSNKEKKCAPIDPQQLLKALEGVLSVECGIRSIEDVPRMACLMKKFSKKLVSRCVYCNVLQATKPDILSEFLDKGGWETINTWLQYAKSSSSDSFLVELLKLCKLLPMTLNRLKENDTAKVIKSLTKHDHKDIRNLSSELVTQWMSIIKGKKSTEISGNKKKKKEKPEKKEKEKAEKVEPTKEIKKSPSPVHECSKSPLKLKGLKRTSVERENKKVEIYEDVKIDPEPLMPVPKKPRSDRPKTVKIYQKNFRATGLEEETPLPKNRGKKVTTVDKIAVAAAKNAIKPSTPLDRIIEKKIKPENLMAINENANTKGIKLIPAKPRPVLHESASFMDALISQPVAPIKRKKKIPHKSTSNTSSTPTSPTTTNTVSPPKLQFYKDTLEMNEETKKDEKNEDGVSNVVNSENVDSSNVEENAENIPMDTTEEGGHTPPNEESNDISTPSDRFDAKNEVHKRVPFDPNNLRSILCHGRRRGKKKCVGWVDDDNIKEIFYFEMDDTERENVSRNSSFYDLKSIEMKREREAMELAKRQAGDRVEDFRRWWIIPIVVECPLLPAEPGCNSMEKHAEIVRQQSTLQEIYFTREMIPDSPHEPDLEIHAPKEPKIIPFDENNAISAVSDFSNFKILPAELPDILSNLMRMNTSLATTPTTQNVEPMQVPSDSHISTPKQPLLDSEPVIQPSILLPQNPTFEQGLEPIPGPPNGLFPQPSPMFSPPQPEVHSMEMRGEWQTPQDMSPTDHYYSGFPAVNHNLLLPNQPPHIRAPGGNRPNIRGGPRGPPRPVRNRTICRHFALGCRFGMSCNFLHPGVNGPPL